MSIRKLSKVCLEVTQRVSGESLEGVWKVYQVMSSQDWSSQDRSSQDKSGQVRTGLVMTGQFRKGQVRTVQVRTGPKKIV